MHQISNSKVSTSSLPSPKSLNHAEIMSRINQQLQQVMDLNSESQQRTKSQLKNQIQRLTKQYQKQLQSLKLKQHLLQSTHSFTQQQNRIKYEQLQHQRDCLLYENKRLKEQIVKNQQQMDKMATILGRYKNKIKNQESLIDQYKCSIQQQIKLQKQVIRNTFMQKQLSQKLQFDKALKCMQQNYQRKIAELRTHNTYKQYQTQIKQLKKFCSALNLNKVKNQQNGQQMDMDSFQTANKRKSRQNLKSYQNSSVKKLIGNSSYSTLEK